jgi:hypothetical protein
MGRINQYLLSQFTDTFMIYPGALPITGDKKKKGEER